MSQGHGFSASQQTGFYRGFCLSQESDKKWPSRITSLLNIAVEKDKKLLLEGTNSGEMASIIDLATQTMALTVLCGPQKGKQQVTVDVLLSV